MQYDEGGFEAHFAYLPKPIVLSEDKFSKYEVTIKNDAKTIANICNLIKNTNF
jgi:hypothetical protein